MLILIQKIFRDLSKKWMEFLAVFFMSFLAIAVFTSIDSVYSGMEQVKNDYFAKTNAANGWVYAANINGDALNQIQNISSVQSAERCMSADVQFDKDGTILSTNPKLSLTVPDGNNISVPLIRFGSAYSSTDKDGVWLSCDFAQANHLKVGDSIQISNRGTAQDFVVRALVYNPEYIYYTGSSSRFIPDNKNCGYCMISPAGGARLFPHIIYNSVKLKLKKSTNLESNLQSILGDQFKGYYSQKDNPAVFTFTNKITQLKKMALIFTTVFILVAVLSLVSSITRLIRVSRKEIGILRALGFFNREILACYLLYGMTVVTASIAPGFLFGYFVVSPVLLNIQKTIFSIPTWHLVFTFHNVLIALFILLSSFVTTLIICMMLLHEQPCENIRPKNEKSGRHLLIEKCAAVWNSMSFFVRHAVRNYARAKFRSFMVIISVLLSMLLLIAGMGLQDSITYTNQILYTHQYYYQSQIILNAQSVHADMDNLLNQVSGNTQQLQEEKAELSNGGKQNIYTVDVLQDGNLFSLIYGNQSTLLLPADGVYITRKCASEMKITREGQTIHWRIPGEKTYYTGIVKKIIDTPMPQGLFMSQTAWQNYGKTFEPKILMVSSGAKYDANRIKNLSYIDSVVKKSTQYRDTAVVLNTVSSIALMLMISAILLCVVILYNIGILNFIERANEFVIFKILGYFQKELCQIVLSENMMLATIGWILGMPAGIAFLKIYITVISPDNMMFLLHLSPVTFVLSTLISLGCILFVNFQSVSRVGSINMVSELKNIEE